MPNRVYRVLATLLEKQMQYYKWTAKKYGEKATSGAAREKNRSQIKKICQKKMSEIYKSKVNKKHLFSISKW